MKTNINKLIEQITDMYIFLSCVFTIFIVYLIQGITLYNFIIFIVAILTGQRYYFKFKQLMEKKEQ